MKQKLIFTNQVGVEFDNLIMQYNNPQVVIIADSNTAELVVPKICKTSKVAAGATLITIKAGDDNKNLEQLTAIWQTLSQLGATRSSIVVNVGGGVVSDIGGFAASTYKRGLRYINIPTTVLAAVDASVGGKTGINFNGYKNQIGTFAEAETSIISANFFDTLPLKQVSSGYAEMLKHGLLDSTTAVKKLIAQSPAELHHHPSAMLELISTSVAVKQHIVEHDFTETGLRKALNLGHTAGHAFESFAMKHKTAIPHGYAVAYGLVVALILSHTRTAFPSEMLHSIASYIRENYGAMGITCNDYPELLDAMHQDKKNDNAKSVNFTLLKNVGEPQINSQIGDEDICVAFDIYRDLMHLA